MTKKGYSLREKKHAKTKIALANAFIEKLSTTRFSDISIKEICRKVDVSEGTFYNYFPQKFDVIAFFQHLHLLRLEWEAELQKDRLKPLELIEMAFELMGKINRHPYLFYEIVSVFTSEHMRPKKGYLTAAEKFYAFPDCPGIENVTVESLEDFFRRHLEEAKKQSQIGKDINMEDLALAFKTILIGTPLAIEAEDFSDLSKRYKTQLELLKKSFMI